MSRWAHVARLGVPVGVTALLAVACSSGAATPTDRSSAPRSAPTSASTSSDAPAASRGSGASPPTAAVDEPDAATTTTNAPSPPVKNALADDAPFEARLRAAGVPVIDDGDDLYATPKPLSPAAPGTIIRVQVVRDTHVVGADVLRVMYHSRNRADVDRAVTGTIVVPRATAPVGGWPVVSWTHGTTGIGAPCAPSRRHDMDQVAQHHVDLGYVWVSTDYDGLGPNGERHSYLSGVSEGRSAIDIVRAVRNLPTANASARWAVAGHSQGGHAALFAGQIAATYAPELELVGVQASAPVSDMRNLGTIVTTPGRSVLLLAILGLPVDYPELKPATYLAPEIMAEASLVDRDCSTGVYTMLDGRAASMLMSDPATADPLARILLENEPGHVTTPVPIFITHGATDTLVPTDTSRVLVERLCSMGQVVARKVYPGEDHGGVFMAATPDIDYFLAQRFAGAPPYNSCDDR